jgi:hypothetical protein
VHVSGFCFDYAQLTCIRCRVSKAVEASSGAKYQVTDSIYQCFVGGRPEPFVTQGKTGVTGQLIKRVLLPIKILFPVVKALIYRV